MIKHYSANNTICISFLVIEDDDDEDKDEEGETEQTDENQNEPDVYEETLLDSNAAVEFAPGKYI